MTDSQGRVISRMYPTLQYRLKLRRNPSFYLSILVVPCILLSCLTLVLFWLPPESPAKMMLGMNIFVAFFVLLLLLAESTPSAVKNFPLIGALYCLNMTMITLSTFLACIVINLYFRGDRQGPVPQRLRRIFIEGLGRLLLVRQNIPLASEDQIIKCMNNLANDTSRSGRQNERRRRKSKRSRQHDCSPHNHSDRREDDRRDGDSQGEDDDNGTGSWRQPTVFPNYRATSARRVYQQQPQQQTPYNYQQRQAQSHQQKTQTTSFSPRQHPKSMNHNATYNWSGVGTSDYKVSSDRPTTNIATAANSTERSSLRNAPAPPLQTWTTGDLLRTAGEASMAELLDPYDINSPLLTPASRSEIEKDVFEVRRYIRRFVERQKTSEQRNLIAMQWRTVALVLDRLFFVLYLLAIVVAIVILMPRRNETSLPEWL